MVWVLIMDTHLIAACLIKDLGVPGIEQTQGFRTGLQISQVDMELTVELDKSKTMMYYNLIYFYEEYWLLSFLLI